MPSDPNRYLSVANTDEVFTQALESLLNDDDLVADKLAVTREVLLSEFSEKAALDVLREMFRPE